MGLTDFLPLWVYVLAAAVVGLALVCRLLSLIFPGAEPPTDEELEQEVADYKALLEKWNNRD